ncbi:winged helix-turn-helix domain-containing protein [Labilibacter sediminis]|nr:winged helix-turn-helix domain-containing protein [Labilibacter sediminis]
MGLNFDSLSKLQAQKIILHSQKVPPPKYRGRAIEATLSVIEHLGYVQIDTISAIQRAHHHTLWNRNPRYQIKHLHQLMEAKKVFEYWSHAAAYLPVSHYRFSLIRKQSIAREEQGHWYPRDKQMMKYVLDRIKNEGPLMARDFEHNGKKTSDWGSKPAKIALEYLFMQGELMVPNRVNFHKVYDLTERVLPEEIDVSTPTQEEYARFLIIQYLSANGLGQVGEITYLIKNVKPFVARVLQDMLDEGEVIQVSVGENNYYTLLSSLDLLNKPLSRNKLKILSPFDNLLIQRKRMQVLFDFDYQIECYVPEAKRKYGYFSLPVLWDGKLVARIDCKAERKKSVLHIKHLVLEFALSKTGEFAYALIQEIIPFMRFNECKTIVLHRVTPSDLKKEIEGLIKNALA